MIYADNAATTKLLPEAFEAMKPFLLEEYGNASQPYSFSRTAKKALRAARETIAACIHAKPEEIFFTSGGTESDNWALKGAALYGCDGQVVITSCIEHHAILNTCRGLECLGIPVVYLPVTGKGVILPERLEEHITDHTKIVSVMFANNEIGTIQPISELAAIAHQHGALFHTDAVQAVGHVPIDVKALDVDMLSASAHKFNGPKGIGFLYIRKGTKLLRHMSGGAQEAGMRAGTENIAAIVAMAEALKNNCDNMENTAQRLLCMETAFITMLQNNNIDFIRNGAQNHIPGNLSVSIKNANGEMLLHRLDLMGICVSTGSACDSTRDKLSHVIESIALPEEYAKGTIRISFGRYNREADAYEVAKSLIQIIGMKQQ